MRRSYPKSTELETGGVNADTKPTAIAQSNPKKPSANDPTRFSEVSDVVRDKRSKSLIASSLTMTILSEAPRRILDTRFAKNSGRAAALGLRDDSIAGADLRPPAGHPLIRYVSCAEARPARRDRWRGRSGSTYLRRSRNSSSRRLPAAFRPRSATLLLIADPHLSLPPS